MIVDRSRLVIAAVVVAYCIISISMVFLNKHLGKEAPLFVTWYQCVVTVLISIVLGEIGERSPQTSFFKQFPKFEYKTSIAQNIMQLSLIFVSMISLNNLCLKYVEVSFYNVARSLTIVFNVLFSFFVLHISTSRQTLGTLVIVIFGFLIGTEGEVHLSLIGSFFGILASMAVALNGIFSRKVMVFVDNNSWKLSMYNNMNGCFLFLPLILLFETDTLLNDPRLFTFQYWFWMTVCGVVGFAMGIITIIQIKVTSPLTHNVVGTAKAALQTILALWYYQNPSTFNGNLGTAVVLGGSLLYSYIRTVEDDAAKKRMVSPPMEVKARNDSEEEAGGLEEQDTEPMLPRAHSRKV